MNQLKTRFEEGDRVSSKEGLIGTVLTVEDGALAASHEAWYEIEFDNGQMLGTYAEGYEKICSTCDGSREVTTMERVYPGEPHEAPIGTARCPDCSPIKN